MAQTTPTFKRAVIPRATITPAPQTPPPAQQGSVSVVIGKAPLLTVTNAWPDYPAVAILGVSFNNNPNFFPGLGPSKCWIPVSHFAIDRDPALVKPHFFFSFEVKQGPWTDALTAQQGSNWPIRYQFHETTNGVESSVLGVGTCKSVRWSFETGKDTGLVAEVVFECDNYLIKAP